MTVPRLAPSTAELVIGYVSGPLTRHPDQAGESTLGAVVADAVQTGAKTFCENVATLIDPRQLHADLGRSPRNQGDNTTEITVAAALRALPFSEMATTVMVTGAQLHQVLEEQLGHGWPTILQPSQQLSYHYSPHALAGSRVDPASITIGGTVVDAATTYKISVSDTLRGDGGSPTLQAAPPIPNGSAGGIGGAGNGTLFDLLAAYLSTRNPLPVPTGGRVVRSA
ncbi:MAG: 5'-nucleotidase C-terminal domain-containing protein [Mycobacterium sp.]|nr:5'-nucleotidase C-terminal domain-containing protein [Mycobacterium sp.]